MFLASLEMDMEGVRKQKAEMTIFGILTFIIPFILCFALGISILNYSVLGSLIIGCIMSSNTLIAYPMVSRYGLARKPSVSLSVGSSMMALLFSLIMLAAIVSSANGSGGLLFWLWFAAKFIGYCFFLGYAVPRLTRHFLRRYSDSVTQFIFVMAMLFMCAALSEAIGLEGIFGAFMAGLILNRYIPHLSPLMNHIEFTGNALFIPYFLIGVGMLINVNLLFEGRGIILAVVLITLFGTLGKAIAAYASQWFFRLPMTSGHMMFGLTSAHAAGAIAIVMVGMRLKNADGSPLVDANLLNIVVLMILFSCIISTFITEYASQRIIMRDEDMPEEKTEKDYDDERLLVPVKYAEYANWLVDLAVMLRNPKLNRSLIGLNVVYDDDSMETHQENGKRLLEQVTQHAMASNVRVQSQVRIAANIANGIMHAFKEYHCSEVVIGMHSHKEISNKFWGAFHQNLFNGLNRQIIMARLLQPLNTLRYIQIVVPSRAQLEPGFYRWLERMCRLASNLDCRIRFYARQDTMQWITKYVSNRHSGVRAEYEDMEHWNQMPAIASTIADDHLFVVVTARKGTISFKNAQERLPDELTKYFSGKNLMIIFPDQHGNAMEEMNFAQPQLQGGMSAYEIILRWVQGIKHKMAKK
jgi:Kef-type K+ transport system membrane component KefB